MADGILTGLVRALARPVGGVLSWVHGRVTGSDGVLELRITDMTHAMELQMLLARLRRAASDPGLRAVLLHLDGSPGSWASCEDLRAVIVEIRAAGRTVWVHLRQPGNGLIWVASAADRVSLSPMGEVGLVGVSLEVTYLGRLLDRVGVSADLQAAGTYKSFGETFQRTSASAASREALSKISESLSGALIGGLMEGRDLSRSQVEDAIASSPLRASEALERGLVDVLLYGDEVADELIEVLGEGAHKVQFSSWARTDGLVVWAEQWGRRETLAVVHLEGAVVMQDDTGRSAIRAPAVVELLDELREDHTVKAVVLHVTSPGGSAFASDLIWRAVQRLGEDKPVVAAYGDVSASGGVYLSAAAGHVVARATTLTGSIGVVGGKLVVADALRKLGVVSQSFPAEHANTMMSGGRTFTREERARFRASLQAFYDAFVERVARGRGLEVDTLEPHCRGRVWTGVDALERGIVDEIGDLQSALDHAAAQCGLQRYRRTDLSPASPRPILDLVRMVLGRRIPSGLRSELLDTVLGRQGATWMRLLEKHPGKPLAMLPFVIERD